jgi:hypothetical protein
MKIQLLSISCVQAEGYRQIDGTILIFLPHDREYTRK